MKAGCLSAFIGYIAISVAIGAPAAAQTDDPLRAGARVRFTLRGLTPPGAPPPVLYTRLWVVSPGRVTVRGFDVDTTSVIPNSIISRMEVSRGRSAVVMLGTTAVGVALGAVIAPAVMTEDPVCVSEVAPRDLCRKETSDEVVGAIVGGIVFGVLSRAIARERWRNVPLDYLLLARLPSGPTRIGFFVPF